MKLTLPQQDVYFEQLLYPDRPIYNIGAKILIDGVVDYDILNKAYVMLINQHDAYRNTISYDKEEVTLKILDYHNSVLEYLDFSEKENPDDYANTFMQKRFEKPFDLGSGSLLHKFILIKVKDSFFYLFSMYHHIITDGWGTSLMFQRLVQNYNELLENGEVITSYPYSYVSFVEDDQKYYESENFVKDKLYWSKKFQNPPERFLNKINENTDGTTSKRKTIKIKRSLYNKLEEIAKECRGSMFHVILGILYTYFGRKHQNHDLAIGLPVLNRGKSVFKKTVGLFMGVTALRVSLEFENTFEELIIQIKQQLRHDYRHQRFPLGKLIQELDMFIEKDRLFNITLSYEKQNYADHFRNTTTKVIPMSHHAERVGLALYIREFDDQEDVLIDFDYNIAYFDQDSINQVATHFEKLMISVSKNPKKKLSEYTYLSKSEERELLEGFNQTSFNYSKNHTLLDFFEEQVRIRPNDIAVRDISKLYTYSEFDQKSDRVAHYLIKNFLDNDKKPIGVIMDRSADLVVVLMGIIKSGVPYIPLDPDFPEERLHYISKHSEITCLIGTEKYEGTVDSKAVFLDVTELMSYEDSLTKAMPKVTPNDAAYIIYTSGSTGKPKGVVIGHQSLLNFLLSIQKKPGIKEEDLLFSVTTQSFDISILEFFVPLITGATVYIADKEVLLDPLVLIEQLKIISPTIIQATPSFYQMLFNAGWQGNKKLKVLCGGDLISQSLAKKMIYNCSEIWNMYGPTETTIWSSVKQLFLPEEASNIGKPIQNTSFYILDEHLQLLPKGAIGTIYIGGDGLAQGYLKNKELTNSKFVPSPFFLNEKIYNTGDLGRWTPQGEVEFLGRNDHQVKIRGYRIELGEIETKLNQLKTIISSVVIAKKSENQEAILVAYVISNNSMFDGQEVIREIRKELPEYMIPYTIIRVEHFPLTPNNKIDRGALTKREIKRTNIHTEKKPETVLETKINELFKEVLEFKNEIGVTDNFFSLGGHSLNAVKLIGKLGEELHYHVSLKDIFDHPTVRSLSTFLEKKCKKSEHIVNAIEKKSFYAVTIPQYVLWLAGIQKQRSIAYNMFSAYDIEGELNNQILNKCFQTIINKYEILRTNFIEIEGFPYQKVTSENRTQFSIEHFYCKENEIHEALESYANKEFDLEHDTLIRIGLFQNENNKTVLLFVTHHIIMDGWSLEILIKELVNTYRTLSKKITDIEQPLNFQFKEYAEWQTKEDQKNKKINSDFWKQYLFDYSWESLIPYDYELTEKKHLGAFYNFELNNGLLEKIEGIVKNYKITFHSLLSSVFSILIHKVQGHEDICIGTINSGRTLSDFQEQIGMFVKTLPLRVKIKKEPSFLDVAHMAQNDLLAIDKHQDIPFEILNSLRLEAILVLQNTSFTHKSIDIDDGLSLISRKVQSQYNRLPLLMNLSLEEHKLCGSIQYDISKYEEESIALLALKFERILEQICENPNISIGLIDTNLMFEEKQTVAINFSF
ncbi:non-ribosomal peptide synthetase [Aquimarina pacifica]|uniref:non-ribosomal peptide synthetase n=1 Tax=Aquimarina pacifica TaxID=1296415 RepID=UPI0004702491|nr:non-ribosomal peptide synthetase [Aquimarina pacifica]